MCCHVRRDERQRPEARRRRRYIRRFGCCTTAWRLAPTPDARPRMRSCASTSMWCEQRSCRTIGPPSGTRANAQAERKTNAFTGHPCRTKASAQHTFFLSNLDRLIRDSGFHRLLTQHLLPLDNFGAGGGQFALPIPTIHHFDGEHIFTLEFAPVKQFACDDSGRGRRQQHASLQLTRFSQERRFFHSNQCRPHSAITVTTSIVCSILVISTVFCPGKNTP